MTECKHGLDLGTCATCRGPKGPFFITRGGSHYHSRKDCPTLASGQAEAIERGYQTHPIETVTYGRVDRESRVPCKTCVELP